MKALWAMGVVLGLALAQTAQEYSARCLRFYQTGALESARATCELALVSEPEFKPALRLLVRIHLEEGNLAEARAYLERLGEDPEAPLLRGRLYLLEGRFRDVLGLSLPETPEGRFLKARALEGLGRYEEALREVEGLPPTGEVRLLAARLLLALGRPEEALGRLGGGLEEEALRGRLLFLLGRPKEAAELLEGLLPRLTQSPALYREALATLTQAYLGQGDWGRGLAALGQLARVVNLPALFLAKAWPWLLVLLLFLVLVLYGESRIEPLRTVEIVPEAWPGPGTLLLQALFALALALAVALFWGKSVYGNLFALATPHQGGEVLPLFYLAYGLFLLGAVLLFHRSFLSRILGPWPSWTEGFPVGVLLLLALLLFGLVRPYLGLPTLPLHLLTFLGLALMEPFFRGLVPQAYRERYRELGPYLSALLYPLLLPGPTVLLLLLSAGLLWLRARAQGTLGLGLGFVVAGVVLALLPPPWLRRL
ncbi:tetratricopeptide repeat protein [Thermus oshimai]|uniref:tetratricopeptide repeat protein n=1 Tax=Thermus oshimai TaxID=56957 RepID=UPI00036A5E07|nr:hypothetical protein [Thermus oshimai]